MSQFVSWIEYEGKTYFLKNSDLDTKEGRKIYPKIKDDLCGHGAILEYYPELKNKRFTEKECTDFSNPDNFPKEIAKAIKKGQMSRIGICVEVLNTAGKIKCDEIEQPALAEYKKIEQPALAEYEKIKQSAWAEYGKIKQSAWVEYEKIQQPAWAEYKKIQQSALAEYRKIEQVAFSKIVSQKKYRKEEWK